MFNMASLQRYVMSASTDAWETHVQLISKSETLPLFVKHLPP